MAVLVEQLNLWFHVYSPSAAGCSAFCDSSCRVTQHTSVFYWSYHMSSFWPTTTTTCCSILMVLQTLCNLKTLILKQMPFQKNWVSSEIQGCSENIVLNHSLEGFLLSDPLSVVLSSLFCMLMVRVTALDLGESKMLEMVTLCFCT